MSQPNFTSLFKLLVYISSFPNFLVSQRGLSTAFGSRNVGIYPIYQFLKRKGITCLDLQPLFLLLQSIKWILQTFKVSILIEMCKSNADQIHLSKIQNLVSLPTSKSIKLPYETSYSGVNLTKSSTITTKFDLIAQKYPSHADWSLESLSAVEWGAPLSQGISA